MAGNRETLNEKEAVGRFEGLRRMATNNLELSTEIHNRLHNVNDVILGEMKHDETEAIPVSKESWISSIEGILLETKRKLELLSVDVRELELEVPKTYPSKSPK